MKKANYQKAHKALEQITKTSYQKNQYMINIDRIIYQNLTRHELAFVVQVFHLNKANLVSTNEEYAAFLGTTKKGTNISAMIKNINIKVPDLIKIDFNTRINHKKQIKSQDKAYYRYTRGIFLTRPLHIKGANDFVSVPAFALQKRSCFVSGNELRVYQYLKALPEHHFSGFLEVISKYLNLTINKIKYALKHLKKIGALYSIVKVIKNKLKNVFYSSILIGLKKLWQYQYQISDQAKELVKKNRYAFLNSNSSKIKIESKAIKNISINYYPIDNHNEPPPEIDHDWDELMDAIGGL